MGKKELETEPESLEADQPAPWALPLRVEAKLGPILQDLDTTGNAGERLRQRLERSARELAEDFGFPVNLSTTLSRPKGEQALDWPPFTIKLNDVPCQINLMDHRLKAADPEALGEMMAETIFNNRTSLLSDDLIRWLLDERQRAEGSSLADSKELRALLTSAFRSCFDVQTTLELCSEWFNCDGPPEAKAYAFETLAAMRFPNTVTVECGRAQYEAALQKPKDSENSSEHSIDKVVEMMRDGLFWELGLRYPPIRIIFDEALGDNEFRVKINRIRGPFHQGIDADKVLVNDTVSRLTFLNVKGVPAVNPANGEDAALIDAEFADLCESAGLTTWDQTGYLVLVLSTELRQHVGVFFTIAQAEQTFHRFNEAFPMVMFNVLERYSPVRVAEVLRELLHEEISIRDLRSIFEAMLALNGTTRVDTNKNIVFTSSHAHLLPSDKPLESLTSGEIADFVRSQMKRYISFKYSRGGNTLVVDLLAPEIEDALVNSDETPLSAAHRWDLLKAIFDEVGHLGSPYAKPVILTSQAVRRRLRALVEGTFPALAVLSFQELSPDMQIQPIARISWPEEEPRDL